MQTVNAPGQGVIADANAIVSLVALPQNDLATTAEFDKAVASSSYLARVQLFGSNSGAVKEDKIGQGRFGLVRTKDSIEDLTKAFNCLPLDWRWKAMQIADGTVVSVFDYNSADFQKLKDTADDKSQKDTGCMWGVEFLIWLPEQRLYATFYLSSATARREAVPLRKRIGAATTITSNLIKKPKFSWFGPVVSASSSPMTPPDVTEINEQILAFRKSAVAAKAKATGGEAVESSDRD